MNSNNVVTPICLVIAEDLHQVTKTQNEQLENENARLHGELSVCHKYNLQLAVFSACLLQFKMHACLYYCP